MNQYIQLQSTLYNHELSFIPSFLYSALPSLYFQYLLPLSSYFPHSFFSFPEPISHLCLLLNESIKSATSNSIEVALSVKQYLKGKYKMLFMARRITLMASTFMKDGIPSTYLLPVFSEIQITCIK